MSKHTPGPWCIRAERYRFIHVYATGGGICHLDTVDGEGAANARLIAAAPDLLLALQMAMPALDLVRAQFPRHPGDDSIDVVAAARAAIRKATGE